MATRTEPKSLQEAILYFSDYANCHEAMIGVRWHDGVVRCPQCGSDHVTYLQKARVWKCYGKHLRPKFSLKTGTVFEDSPLPLQKWLPALWLLTNCKNGISSYELARALKVTQKTAWFMLHRLRLALQDDNGGKSCGEIEADETFIGGKARNMHHGKRERLGITKGRSMAGKTAVFGLLRRHGKDGHSRVKLATIKSNKRRHLMPHVTANVEQGATIHTDALTSYVSLENRLHPQRHRPRRGVRAGHRPHQRDGELLVAAQAGDSPTCRSNRSICFATLTNNRSVSTNGATMTAGGSKPPSRASSIVASLTKR